MLSTVLASSLEEAGITLGPADVSPGVPKDKALQSVMPLLPPTDVHEVVLAHVVDAHQNPVFDHTCWVVAGRVPGRTSSGPAGTIPLPQSFMVAFVDAQSGAFLFSLEGFGNA